MYIYILINFFSILIPFIYSFDKRLNFHRTWFAFWPAVLITGAAFILWDVYFTKWGVWGFDPRYLIGIDIVNLPLEEWLFFICIPYACVFTYFCLKILVKKDYLGPYAKWISGVLSGILLILGVANIDQIYTSVTFISTAIFLILHLTIFKSDYLGRFYLSYLIVFLGPFLIVNGILTGSFIEDQVVWYNNAENFSIRVFTIPIEDFIYGLLLILMNVTIYEAILSRKKTSPVVESPVKSSMNY